LLRCSDGWFLGGLGWWGGADVAVVVRRGAAKWQGRDGGLGSARSCCVAYK